MDYYAGIDVSLKQSSVCVVDGSGKIVLEAKAASDPAAVSALFGDLAQADLVKIHKASGKVTFSIFWTKEKTSPEAPQPKQ